jgi:prepilin-type N-terminal cleavage/methylation domain-containing protein/prepilin-type processing-associated H-X9-DG protein
VGARLEPPAKMKRRAPRGQRGLTLVELLVVIAIIAVLAGILVPMLKAGLVAARRAACISNLRQIGAGIAAYAGDNNGQIPYGPKAPPFTNPFDFYPSTGAPTSLISLQSGQPVGLGLLLAQYLSKTPQVLFCPGADQPMNVEAQLAQVGVGQAQSSYYYRHGGNPNLFDPQGQAPAMPNISLANLGVNSQGVPIRALVMDTVFFAAQEFSNFGINTQTNHQQGHWVNVLYADGHVNEFVNNNGRFNVNDTSYSSLDSSFSSILSVFEKADALP